MKWKIFFSFYLTTCSILLVYCNKHSLAIVAVFGGFVKTRFIKSVISITLCLFPIVINMKKKYYQKKTIQDMLKRTFQRGDDTNPKNSLFSSNILLISNRLTYLSNYTEFLCFLFCFGIRKYMFKQLEISFLFMKKELFFVNWKTTTFGDIKEYFPTVCKIFWLWSAINKFLFCIYYIA